MRELISFALLLAVVAPTCAGLVILLRHEVRERQTITGGYGVLTIFGFLLVFVIMPVFSYFVRF